MADPRILFTIGYEGSDLDAFIAQLRKAGVRLVADVRELPLSRKRGFSKRPLAEALDAAGIAYLHVPALGTPKPVRDAYKAGGPWSAFAASYQDQLAEADQPIKDLAEQAAERPTALLCFEADPQRCHRSLLADELLRRGLVDEVRHLAR